MPTATPTHHLLLGPGYLGARVAALWRQAGDSVTVVTRAADRASQFRREGLSAVVADVTRPESLANLPAADSVLFAVGFDRTAAADIHAVYADGLKNVLAALPSTVQRVTYISTTGVYGPAAGDWVDETTPPDPHRDGGGASLAAEQVLAAHPLGRRSAILRLAGLYGPSRVPYLDKLRAGEPLAVPSEGWLNLIHVKDAARIVVAVDEFMAESLRDSTTLAPHIFNVTDGAPVQRGEYYAEVARLIGAATPAFSTPPADSPAAVRAGADRRVRNEKLLRTVDFDFDFPTYREGLAAIISADMNT